MSAESTVASRLRLDTAEFVFPAVPTRPRDLRPMSAHLASAPSSSSISQRRSVNVLPHFSFNPSANSSVKTPPLSPAESESGSSSRTGGFHRRGGSEFIGGGGRDGRPAILSSSPSKLGPFTEPEPPVLLAPPPHRRGHSHKRSSAMSGHDLQSILRPRDSNVQPSPSAPVSPNVRNLKAVVRDPIQSAPPWQAHHISGSRSRVGFSDRIEVIRPLSTISSGTESSLSTVRGHSISESSSSVLSHLANSPPVTRIPRTSLDTTFEDEDTAQQSSPAASPPRTELAASPSRFSIVSSRLAPNHHSRSSIHIDTSFLPPSPTASPLGKFSSPTQSAASTKLSPGEPDFSLARAKPGQKPPFRRPSNSQLLSGPTPSAPSLAFLDPITTTADFSAHVLSMDSLDVDETVTLVSEHETASSAEAYHPDSAEPSSLGPSVNLSDSLGPSIDLDAALGPFNTPGPSNYSSHGRHRRFMHSAATGANSIHRRSESAPELEPFDSHPPYPAVPAMADVFEEDEENGDDSDKTVNKTESPLHSGDDTTPTCDSVARPASFVPTVLTTSSAHPPADSPHVDSWSLPNLDAKASYVTACEPSRPQPVKGSGSSVNLGLVDTDCMPRRPYAANLQVPHNVPCSPSFSSPTLSSNHSLDTPRLGTAASSVADYRVATSITEPNDARLSVDDVPSLTSSRSTMTNPYQTSAFRDVRTASACSIVTRATQDSDHIRRRRGSIVSLSRLMSASSFSERSKLSIEQRPQSAMFDPNVSSAPKKPSRLSRMMRFLRSREREALRQ